MPSVVSAAAAATTCLAATAAAAVVAVPTSASAESGGIEWLWGTPILAVPASNSEGINGPMSAYMEGLAATEPPEIRSNRNGAWQSRNKAWLVPESHKKAVGIRKHVKTLRGSILAALHKYFVDHLRLGVEPVGRRGNASSIGEPPAVEVTIDASWANVNPPCSINGPHVHPFSVVSGAYYVDCGGDAGERRFCKYHSASAIPRSRPPGLARSTSWTRDRLHQWHSCPPRFEMRWTWASTGRSHSGLALFCCSPLG
mmetsp:Transcript_15270/g.48917  ORF Transcript_15270/g.48917 Transcript_15270/m.48917 type:complete len:256 (-) Transcript_15270:173-940(-)